jgi:hemolysin-activating ACP:hemolysin acyltransferase
LTLFLTWAGVSGLVKTRTDKGKTDLELTEWRSGNNIVVLDCVSPFNPKQVFEEEFWKGVREKV